MSEACCRVSDPVASLQEATYVDGLPFLMAADTVAMRRDGDVCWPIVYLRGTCRVPGLVPRMDLRAHRVAGEASPPPTASGSQRPEAASTVLAPTGSVDDCSASHYNELHEPSAERPPQ